MLPLTKPKLSNLFCVASGKEIVHNTLSWDYCNSAKMLRRQKCSSNSGNWLVKAHDCLPYDLLVTKPHSYGFGLSSLKMIYSYLTSRKQRVKINSTYSSWLDVKSGVPQGSVLGPLLSIFSLKFYAVEDSEVCNFADDTTIYALSQDLESMIAKLEIDAYNILKPFASNFMVANPKKFRKCS